MRARPAAAAAAALALAAGASRAAPQDEGPKPWAFRTEERITRIAPSPDGKRLYLGDRTGVVWIHDAADGAQVGKLVEHKGSIETLAFVGADPALLVSATRPEFVRLWDGAKGTVRRRFGFPGEPAPEERAADGTWTTRWDHVFAVAVSRDTPLFATADPTHRVVVWDAAKDAEAASFTFENWAVGAALAPDLSRIALSIASDDEHRVEVRTLADGAALWSDGVHEGDADAAARRHLWEELEYSPDGKSLLSWGWASKDDENVGGMRAYDAATGKRRWTRLYDFNVWDVAYSPAGDRIALSSPRGVSLFDAETGDEVLGLESASGVMADVAFSPDGRYLYAAPYRAEGIVRWDVRGEVKEVAPPTPRPAPRLDAPPPAAGAAGAKPAAAAPRGAIAHGAAVTAIAVAPAGARIATGGRDGAVRVWDVASGAKTAEFTGVGGAVTWVGWVGGDEDRLAACGDDGTVRSFAIASHRKRCEFAVRTDDGTSRAPGRAPFGVAASTAGPELFVAALDGGVVVHDAETGSVRSSVRGAEPGAPLFLPQAVAVSPNARRIVAMGTDIARRCEGRVFDRDRSGASWTETAGLADREDASPVDYWHFLAMTRDGAAVAGLAHCASLGRDGKDVRVLGLARCWNLAGGALRWRVEFPDVADAAALSPRGDVFAVAERDGAHLLSMSDGTDTRTLPGGGQTVTALAFSPDGARLFAGTKSGAVIRWSVAAGK